MDVLHRPVRDDPNPIEIIYSYNMEQEEKKTEAPVKPTRTRAPRKSASKAPAAVPSGDVGEPAASVPAPAKTSKPRAPRRKKETPAEAPAPVPVETPAPAQVVEKTAESAPEASALTPQEKSNHRPRRRVRDARTGQDKPETSESVPETPQPQPATAQTEPNDIPEPPSEFRRSEPVPGFATPEIVGGNEGGGSSNRRKRRRNRNRNRDEAGRDPQQYQPTQVDPEELNRRAWKIFLGEVTEEGLALMDDRTAAEASRRAFKVAEIFLLEAARHRPSRLAAPSAPEAAEAEPTPAAE